MVVDHHKCCNGDKKICKRLNIPLSTVRAIIKKFKRYGTVKNLMGSGRNYICTLILRRMVREATKSPSITVKELQALVASWGHQVSKSTIRHYFHNHSSLEGLPEESTWSFPNIIYIMTGIRCSGQMRPKCTIFVWYSIGMFGIGTESYKEKLF